MIVIVSSESVPADTVDGENAFEAVARLTTGQRAGDRAGVEHVGARRRRAVDRTHRDRVGAGSDQRVVTTSGPGR
jgi:hypothetical protein